MLPYLQDLCETDDLCLEQEYMDFCFENQGNFTAHEIDDINTFTAWWANQVAVNFGLNESDLIKIYGDKADDVHETW